MRWFSRLTLLIAVSLPVWAAPTGQLGARIRRALARSPVVKNGYVGILVVDGHGRKLFSLNADHAFIPASNVKLFSAALALERLGPDKRFTTRVEQRGNDLVVVGGGDANLSGKFLAGHFDVPSPPLAGMDALATEIVAHGTRSVAGDIIGDDTLFLYEPFAPGWAIDDALSDDGAPASALVVNDNGLNVTVAPGISDGSPAVVVIDPPLSLFEVSNHVVTGEPEKVETDRIHGSNLWRLWGSLPVGAHPHTEIWAADDPARFAALALKYSLEQHGVQISGAARAEHRLAGLPWVAPPAGTVIAEHQSTPLLEDLRFIAKTSNNLHADLLLFDVGGSRKAGLEALSQFLDQVGVPREQYRFYDGSGLSRMNLVTPSAVVSLLRYMSASPHFEDWLSILPVSGVDGSLATRLTNRRVKGRIHAKTGSLNHVSALSGYADTRRGERLAFSIFVNNTTADTQIQRDLIDKICSLLVEP